MSIDMFPDLDVFITQTVDKSNDPEEFLDNYFNELKGRLANIMSKFPTGDYIYSPQDLEYKLVTFTGYNEFSSSRNIDSGMSISSQYIRCPGNGSLILKHRFEAIFDIPIKHQPFKITANIKRDVPGSPTTGPYSLYIPVENIPPITSSFNEFGEAEVDVSAMKGYYLQITVNPKSMDELKGELAQLYKSYDSIVEMLSAWLSAELASQKSDILAYIGGNSFERYIAEQKAFFQSIYDSFKAIFDDIYSAIKSLFNGDFFKSVSNPEEILESLGEFTEKAAYVLSDEIVIFLFVYTFYLYCHTLTPIQYQYLRGYASTEIALMLLTGGLTKLADAAMTAADVINIVNVFPKDEENESQQGAQ